MKTSFSKMTAAVAFGTTIIGGLVVPGCERECYDTPHEALAEVDPDSQQVRCFLLDRSVDQEIDVFRNTINMQCTYARSINPDDFDACQDATVSEEVNQTQEMPQACIGSFIYCKQSKETPFQAFSCNVVTSWNDEDITAITSTLTCYLPSCCLEPIGSEPN